MIVDSSKYKSILRHLTQHTRCVTKIPLDHLRMRLMFVCMLHTDH